MPDALFRPRGVAVIGASPKPLSIGNRIVRNLIDHGYAGGIYPVHPSADTVCGLRAWPSVRDIPGPVDLACIVVAAAGVPDAMEACGVAGVKAAIVHSAGFSETGHDGAELERRVLDVAASRGIRVLGPNAQGVLNGDPDARLYASFTFTPLRDGPVSILAQSGGVAEMLNQHLARAGVGIRRYASPGNASDISIPELMESLADDPGTRVALLHLESLPPAGPFLAAAERLRERAAVLAVVSGRTEAGARAVASHTGTLVHGRVAIDAVLQRAGILRYDDARTMVHAAAAIAAHPDASVSRVLVLCNAGGPGILALDRAVEAGLEPATPAGGTLETLRAALPPFAAVGELVDLTATAGPEAFRAATRTLLDDPDVEGLLLAMVTPFFVDCDAVAREIADAAAMSGKPVVASVLTDDRWAGVVQTLRGAGIPVSEFPEDAAVALASLGRTWALRRQASEKPDLWTGNRDAVARILESAERDADGWLTLDGSLRMIQAWGLPVAPWVVVDGHDARDAVAAGQGYPLVLKVDGSSVRHKTDIGAVVMGIDGPVRFQAECDRLARAFPGSRILAQAQAGTGLDLLLGLTVAMPGVPLVALGLGGLQVEALGDLTASMAPLSRAEARRMIGRLRARPLLEGHRGGSPLDVEALVGMLLGLASLALEFPGIRSIDLNPVRLGPVGTGGLVLDSRIQVG
jgi:acetyltransferase